MAYSRNQFTRGWWFIFPGLMMLGLIVGIPLAIGFRYSLHEVFLYDFDVQTFIGLQNYRDVFDDPLYISALKTTVLFTLGNLLICLILGVLIAFLLNARQVKLRVVWMALFLVPFVMTPVVAGIAWRMFMWQQEFGVINWVGGWLGLPQPYWLLESDLALMATIVTNAWHLVPLSVLVFYAALTTIPDELYEAGRMDGTGPLDVLRYIVLPMLRPHILFVSIIIITSTFREFDMIWSLTGGGPGRSTTVLSIFTYQRGIANQNMGIANTVAFTMFIMMATFAWVYITLYRRSEQKT